MLTFTEFSEHEPTRVAALQALFEAAPNYSLTVEGHLPSPTAARAAFHARPAGTHRENKVIGGYFLNGSLVGCLDIVRGYPEPRTAFLGMLLFAESHQGRGYGIIALKHIEELARGWECTALRLAVIETNVRAQHFWRREGFHELFRKETTQYTGAAIVMERAL